MNIPVSQGHAHCRAIFLNAFQYPVRGTTASRRETGTIQRRRMILDHLPPRLANKALFHQILQSVVTKGVTVRKGNILDRLYYPGNPELQWQSLRSDCQFHRIRPVRKGAQHHVRGNARARSRDEFPSFLPASLQRDRMRVPAAGRGLPPPALSSGGKRSTSFLHEILESPPHFENSCL